jgi:hypothetical protein
LKIATWNLDRPWKNGRRGRADLQREWIRSLGAHIWVLTETWSEIVLPGYHGVSTPSSLGTYDASESAVAIWVPEAWGVRTLEVNTATLCVEVLPPDAESPLLVYGTIITWHGDPGGKNWEKHLEEVDRQTTDWLRLHRDYPSHGLIVAGDFNMTLHSDKGYGHQDGRRMVRERLPLAGMRCVTAIDVRDAAHGSLERDNIDHICIDQRMSLVAGTCAIPGSTKEGQRMSDHNGMVIEVSTKVAPS